MPRLISRWLPSGRTSHRRPTSSPNDPTVLTVAVIVGSPISVKLGLVMVYTAVPGSVSAVTVLQASVVPAIGSNPAAIVGLPPAEVTICGAAEPNVCKPGCSAGQPAAVYGPPPGAVAGEVWV